MDPFSHAGWFGHVARQQGRRNPRGKKSSIAAGTDGTGENSGRLKALEKAMQLQQEIMSVGSNSTRAVVSGS